MWVYAAALGLLAIATFGRLMLNGTLGVRFPFILYFPALFIAAWWGGPGPTLLTLALSIPLASYYFIPPLHSFSILDLGSWIAVAMYAIFGLGLTVLAARRDVLDLRRRRADRGLSQREADLRQLADSMPVLIASLDNQQRFVFVNRHAESWYGRGESQVIGRHVREVADEASYTQVQGYLRRALAGETVPFEERLKDADGAERWVAASYVPRRDEQGGVLGVYALVLDITERKMGERALRESEHRFRQLADAMPQIVWTARPDGTVDYMNERWYEFAGRTLTELGAASRLHPDDRARAQAGWRKAALDGGPYQDEMRLQGASGEYRWFLVRAAPIRDGEGKVSKWFGTTTDIDEQKRIEQRLARAVDELNRSNKELEDFAYLTSHDLKEPLRGIRSYTSFVVEDTQGKLDAEVVRKLQIIDRLSQRMEKLISILLYYTQLGRAELSIQPTDLGQVAARVLESLGPVLAKAKASAGPLPVVCCDPAKAAEVLKLLITNSVTFNTSPRPLIELGTKGVDAGGWPAIFVKDNGIGIPSQHHQTVFRIFKRLHGREDFGGGMGAGLAFVKKIVERHGGHVWVESPSEGGTMIRFSLGSEPHAVDAANPDR
jgi:PAS domain S-box-containing protein